MIEKEVRVPCSEYAFEVKYGFISVPESTGLPTRNSPSFPSSSVKGALGPSIRTLSQSWDACWIQKRNISSAGDALNYLTMGRSSAPYAAVRTRYSEAVSQIRY